METYTPKSDSELQHLFEKACANHEQGNFAEAEAMYTSLLEIIPDGLMVLYNYGLLLFENGDFEKSRFFYQKAAKISPENIDVLYNYALSLKQCNEIRSSIKIYEKILTLAPEDFDSLYNLGGCHRDLGDLDTAISCYGKLLEMNPEHVSGLNNISYLYHKTGNLLQAKKHYTKLLEIVPDHIAAQHMLASLDGQELKTAPSEYVTEVFDEYSSHYEKSLLADLEYRVPQRMAFYLNTLLETDHTFKKGLDLGCGTGLAGTVFKERCTHLTGIDLSKNMLVEASKKEIYDILIPTGIQDFLENTSDIFDLVFAADVFSYMGELHGVLNEINRTSSPGGIIVFSTERTENKGYELRKTGRFAHSVSYIQDICKPLGWIEIGCFKENLRRENNAWIEGTLFFFRKDQL